MKQHPRVIPSRILFSLFAIASMLNSGCAILGFGAAQLPPPQIKAAYKSLAKQSVGTMIWVDRGIRIDYPQMQLDTATSLQNKFKGAQKEKMDELKNTTFPVQPASILRYQLDHPQIESMQLIEVAPKLGVSRLIYIEVDSFQTRPQPGVELFRGEMIGTVKVVEIAPDRTAKIAFEENGVRAVFPKLSPQDGLPGADDYRIYLGTVDAFTTQVSQRFLEHEQDRDNE